MAPVESSTNSTRCHDLPPSRDAIDAARRVRAARVSHRRDEHGVGVARIDDDARDVSRVVEPDVRPVLTRVGRAIHAVAVRPVLAQVGLAAADVDHVRIGRCDRDRADRRDVRLPVGDVRPGRAAVRRLPHAAVHGAEVEEIRLCCDRRRPPLRVRRETVRRVASEVRADRAPFPRSAPSRASRHLAMQRRWPLRRERRREESETESVCAHLGCAVCVVRDSAS